MNRMLTLTLVVFSISVSALGAEDSAGVLSPRNVESPFCYVAGSSRGWPIFCGELEPSDRLALTARQGERVLAEGRELRFSGLHVAVSQAGILQIEAPADVTLAFELDVLVYRDGKLPDRQALTVRRAPPNRRLSYISDLVDDLIRIHWDNEAQRFLPVKKDGFDQYFRRLQAQGVTRLVVWQSPFPLITDTANYREEDWRRFELQAQAILDSQELGAGMRTTPRLKNYEWLRLLMKLRLGFRVDESGRLVLEGIRLPRPYRYLLVTSASEVGGAVELPAELDVVLRSRAGNRLDRVNVYCSLSAADRAARLTRVAGIPADGSYHTGFQAIEKSVDFFRRTKASSWRLGEGSLVIDMGADWSVEMVDFNRSAAREYAVRQLRTILAHDAFDEIFINTRSHTQLAASTVDGVDGVRPMSQYRLHGKNYFHYGIDRAYAPISLAEEPGLRLLADDTQAVERITTWQRGEWQGACQSPDSDYAWRYQRNLAVAQGVRELLEDLEREFPGVRIRAVVPQSENVIETVQAKLATMRKTDGSVYGSDYYRHVWGSLNYIPAIGEGMAMIDLSGLSVEPTFLGIRYLPDQGPLELFVDRYVDDLADNRGSRFQGPRSFIYEAQATLRAADRSAARKRREEIICYLLGREEDVGEVLLYEAADWTYNLPLSDPDVYRHSFLDECDRDGW
jgi:hypothetical protein